MTEVIDYEVKRVAFNQDEFDEVYKYVRPTRPFREVLKERFNEARKVDAWSVLKDWIPLVGWVSSYEKSYFIGDVIAGVTLAIMNVPQAMAYADLANVPPIIGLYTSFVPPLVYAVFGNSRHASIGMFAVASLMVGTVTARLAPSQAINATIIEKNPNELFNLKSVQVAVAVTFTSGIILAIMSILQLHFVASYMSDQLVSGFTTGAAFHVAASQLPKLFGLNIPSYDGLFKLFYILRDVILSLPNTNVPDLVTSIICIVFLHIGKWYINPFVRKRIIVPIPFELVAVIIATAVSYSFDFHNRFNMSIVSTIPTGFPPPRPPNLSLIPDVIVDSIVLSIVMFAVTISVCKLFGQKHGYATKGSQELRALALLQIIGSFFTCHPACSSISRAAVISQTGVNSQLGSVITACMMLIVILWAGFLLEPLPKCILASIVVVALQGLFLQVKKTRQLWVMSQIDLAIWIVAFLATILWDVVQGLAIAIAFALITVIFRTQWPKTAKLVQVGDTEIYRDTHRYQVHTSFSHIVIFRYDAPLLFFNSENFKQRALEEVEKQEDELRTVAASHSNAETGDVFQPEKRPDRIYDLPHLHFVRRKDKKVSERMVHYLIIDASGFTHMDQMGVMSFKDLAEEMAKKRIEVLITSCRAKVRQKCFQCGLFEFVPLSHFFPSIHDAVLFALHKDEIEEAKRLADRGVRARHDRSSSNLTFIERNSGRRASLFQRNKVSASLDRRESDSSVGQTSHIEQLLSADLNKTLYGIFKDGGCDEMLEQHIDKEETRSESNNEAENSDENNESFNGVVSNDRFKK